MRYKKDHAQLETVGENWAQYVLEGSTVRFRQGADIGAAGADQGPAKSGGNMIGN
jgi:hypothetical protein